MLILGLGLKAKFCGHGLGTVALALTLAKKSRPPPKSRGTTKFTIVIDYICYARMSE